MKFRFILTTIVFLIIALSSVAQKKEDPSDSAKSGTFTDKRDKKTYNWIKIGTQTWMVENLAYKPKGGGYWAYDHDNSNVPKYGYLYAFVIAKIACPKGWHLPSDEEWRDLTKSIGGETTAGKRMKSVSGWKVFDSVEATNESGFTGLPGGYRDGYGTFYGIREIGYWWTSTPTEHSYDYAWLRGLFFDKNVVGRYESFRPSGLSVRCVRNLSSKQQKQDTEKQEIIEPMDE